MFFAKEIICAVATPYGNGAIAILRVSGENCLSFLPKFFKPTTKTKTFDAWKVYHGFVFDKNKKDVDEVLLTVFKSPKSYTGEDSFEISCHGNYTLATEILQVLVSLGFRLANPGEFTLRALLNGRIDLAQAESVQALISSKSHAGRANSLKFVEGVFSFQVNQIRQSLIDFLSSLELELDFSEEDVEFSTREEKLKKLSQLKNSIQKLLETYSYSSVLKDGVKIVLAGKPNVGKSSIFNKLIGKNRAIVSHVAGTTRDYLEGSLLISGVECILIDTAGIHEASDFVEKTGIEFSYEQIINSDLVLHIFDSCEELLESRETFGKANILKVLNKADLILDSTLSLENQNFVAVSTFTENGLEKLLGEIQKFIQKLLPDEETIVVTEKRHFEALARALNFLEGSFETLEVGQSQEFVSEFIRQAVFELETLLGKITD
ncbi:tRNA uridine-5-carboxymethylaminomethyl(34) synthesis GTPase MnmE, partial [bacterium]|nr:tRNA uridine-5-carboxymethylaminomethyl(34) synthesis GTPase MnmE [bacterium]